MNRRKSRLPAIVEILARNIISSQEELLEQLALKGYNVTQSTLSRDLKKLRVTKVPTETGYRYFSAAAEPLEGEPVTKLQETLRSSQAAAQKLDISGNLAVIKTKNGYASGLAYDIDMLRSPHVLGTIPGADTVLVVVNEKSPRMDLFRFFCTFLPAAITEEARARFLGERDD